MKMWRLIWWEGVLRKHTDKGKWGKKRKSFMRLSAVSGSRILACMLGTRIDSRLIILSLSSRIFKVVNVLLFPELSPKACECDVNVKCMWIHDNSSPFDAFSGFRAESNWTEEPQLSCHKEPNLTAELFSSWKNENPNRFSTGSEARYLTKQFHLHVDQ